MDSPRNTKADRRRGKSEAQQAARPVPDDTEDWAGPAGMAKWLWFNCRALSLPGLPGGSREGRKNGKRGRSCTKSCTYGLDSRRAPPRFVTQKGGEGAEGGTSKRLETGDDEAKRLDGWMRRNPKGDTGDTGE